MSLENCQDFEVKYINDVCYDLCVCVCMCVFISRAGQEVVARFSH